jgi:ribonuclease P protein component
MIRVSFKDATLNRTDECALIVNGVWTAHCGTHPSERSTETSAAAAPDMHEQDLPTEETETAADARVPCADEDPRRTRRPPTSATDRTEADLRLSSPLPMGNDGARRGQVGTPILIKGVRGRAVKQGVTVVVGVAVSKKAVERNLLKRRLRAILRGCAVPLVVIARPQALHLSFRELTAACERALITFCVGHR